MAVLRSMIKPGDPAGVVSAFRWRLIWSDFRLRLLANIGHLPSHTVRDVLYRRSGLILSRSSNIQWHFGCCTPENIVVGGRTVLGQDCFLDGRDGLVVGRSVNIGAHVSVSTTSTTQASPSPEVLVVAGDFAYRGSHTVVLPGVIIGEGAGTAPGSVVTKDVRPHVLVGGVPAVHIRERSRELPCELRYEKKPV